MMKKILATLFLLFSAVLQADDFCECIPGTVEVRVSYFWPEDSLFRDIYSEGVDYQITGTIPICPTVQNCLFSGLNFWWAADYFEQSGKSIGLKSRTKIQMEPVTAGLKWVWPSSWLRPYIGAGFKYYFVQVHTKDPYVKESIAKNGLGCVAETGLQAFFNDCFVADFFVSYSFKEFGHSSNHHPNVESTWFDVSGINVGGGLGFLF